MSESINPEYTNQFVLEKTFVQRLFRKVGLAVSPHNKGDVYCDQKLIRQAAKLAVDEFIAGRSNFIKIHIETSQCLLVRMS